MRHPSFPSHICAVGLLWLTVCPLLLHRVKLKKFSKFVDQEDALAAATAMVHTPP